MSEPLLTARGIHKSFPGVIALENVDFTLQEGEIHALLGENGAGKSTLIKVITGVERLDEGELKISSQPYLAKSTHEAQELGISTVYQEVNLCANLSVAENICIGKSSKTVNWRTVNQNAKELLKQLDIDIDVTKTLDSYSVAIQQMVAIARAVDVSAKVLILDEPTSSLNSIEVNRLFNIMRRLKEQGMGIVFVTHFLDQVYAVTDKITILRNGALVGEYQTAELQKVELIGKMIGKEYDELYRNDAGEEALEKKRTFMEMNGVTSIGLPKPMDVEIHESEVLGFAGLLGSGRTEISKVLFGADPMLSGSMKKGEKTVKFNKPIDAIRNGIAYCPEDRKADGIVSDLSIRENIVLALQAKKGLFQFISRAESEKIAQKYIDILSIKTPSSDQLIKNLSGGNQQKVILARWLATNPELLILDEPTRGIDIGTKAEIQKLCVDLAHEQGMSVIFISSEIDEMIRSCERIIILDDKTKKGEIAGAEINENIIMNTIAGGDGDEIME